MRPLHSLLLALGFGILAGCSDAPTAPAGAQGARADETTLMTARIGGVSVRSHGAVGNGVADDTDAIRRTIADAVSRGWGWTVYFPAGTYRITSTIPLPSGTWMEGENRTSSVIRLDGGFLFGLEARGSAAGPVTGITVEHLRFTTTQPNALQYALGAITARNVTFRNNEVQQLGLIRTDTYHPDAGWGNKPAATEPDLAANVTVSNNSGYGTGTSSEEGIHLTYVKDVRVTDNTLRDYTTGVTWWGGDGDPGHGGDAMGATRLAQNMLIQGNSVHNVVAGIWGSRGDSIHIYYNTVSECLDVCLDAERTDNARFYENIAINAAGAVMAAYFFSRNVVFEYNHVYQNRSFGNNLLFRLHNSAQDPADMDVTVRYNEFRYTAPSGIGIVQKESALRFFFHHNTLENTVIRGAFNNSGTAQVSTNTLGFNRAPGGPAIQMGYNYGPWGAVMPALVDGHWQVDVRHNTITSSVGTLYTPGIEVLQSGGNAAINSHVFDNEVRGFQPSIRTHSDRADHYFRIAYNRITGSISTSGGNISNAGNVGI